MMTSNFLTHVNHNDDGAKDPQDDNVRFVSNRRFVTPVNVNDDLRRELDGFTFRTAWPDAGGGPTATVNGLPLYAPARYLGQRTQAVQAAPGSSRAPLPPAVKAAGDVRVVTRPGGGVVLVERDRWPWWIWPLAAAAAVAVRGS